MTVRRTPVVDEYVEGSESVVMLPDGRVLALSAVATAVLAVVGDEPGVTPPDLAQVLVAEFGPPPGDPTGESTVRDVVAALTASGLLAPTSP